MSDKDRQGRATMPPLPREDDPPMARPRARLDSLTDKGEPIARVALRAPRVPEESSEHEEVMRALALLTSEKEALAEERRSFEERMQESLRQIVIEEIPRHAPTSLPPRSRSEHGSSSWFAHIPATLMGLAALVGVIAQSCQKKGELSADTLAKITAVNDRLTAHITVSDLETVEQKTNQAKVRSYELAERCYLSPILQKLSVKVDDPEGALACPQMEFFARPLIGSKAPMIQPNATFPIPP